MSESTVAIIPARGGSKGLPNKHLRLLAGRPLIIHTVQAALTARRIDRVMVSTDDPLIARVCRRAGAEVPFMRPRELAQDDTPTAAVIEHAVRWLESRGAMADPVVTLQPTSPLRRASEIDATVALLDAPDIRSAVTVALLPWPSSVVGRVEGGKLVRLAAAGGQLRRQRSAPAVRLTGGVYVTRRELLAQGQLFDERPAVIVVDATSGIDIDTADDLAVARRLVRATPGDGHGS